MTFIEEQNQLLKESITLSKRLLEQNDIQTAIFVVRDMPQLRIWDLSNLAWAMYKQGDATKKEVEFLLNELEKGLEKFNETNESKNIS
jgi:hypothetical protein